MTDLAVKETDKGENKEESPTPEEIKSAEEAKAAEEAKKPKVSPGVQDRFNELTREKHRLREQLSEEKKRSRVLEEEKTQKSLAEIPRPKKEDFEDEDKFYDAFDIYNDKRQAVRQQERDKEVADASIAKRHEEGWKPFNESVAAMDPEQFPNSEKWSNGEGVIYSGFSKGFVMTSPVGAKIAFHFYNNPEVAEKISDMPLAKQSQAMNDLQHEIIKAGESRTVTEAPEPIKPGGGGGGGVIEKDPDKMSVEEWTAHRNKTKKIQ